MFIPVVGSGFYLPIPGSRILGSKKHRIPDPQHCYFPLFSSLPSPSSLPPCMQTAKSPELAWIVSAVWGIDRHFVPKMLEHFAHFPPPLKKGSNASNSNTHNFPFLPFLFCGVGGGGRKLRKRVPKQSLKLTRQIFVNHLYRHNYVLFYEWCLLVVLLV